jgi:hypothetical protein
LKSRHLLRSPTNELRSDELRSDELRSMREAGTRVLALLFGGWPGSRIDRALNFVEQPLSVGEGYGACRLAQYDSISKVAPGQSPGR